MSYTFLFLSLAAPRMSLFPYPVPLPYSPKIPITILPAFQNLAQEKHHLLPEPLSCLSVPSADGVSGRVLVRCVYGTLNHSLGSL